MENRTLCWDADAISESESLEIRMHKPEKKEIALRCEDEWEGPHNGYGCILQVGDRVRFYYRACAFRHQMDGAPYPYRGVICVAESRDGGLTFQKPDLGMYEYNGTRHNNIVFAPGPGEEEIDNFSVFYDENPACPKEERYKALSSKGGGENSRLRYFASEDGYHFRYMREFPLRGTFDTYNVMLWDKESEQYLLYYRGYHRKGGAEIENYNQTDLVKDVRDIRVATSQDFVTWQEHGRIRFAPGQSDMPLYTNQTVKYHRAPHTFLSFPTRYLDRTAEKQNFAHMPLGDRHESITKRFGREGTSVTDCIIMTSKDGFTFDRRDDAFLTPGPENRNNWWYGNCYPCYGLVETEAEEPGAAKEISFYMGEGYRIKPVHFRRYTVRQDGFFSWYAPFRGGFALTKPFLLEEGSLRINFATSALGGLAVTLCDENGAPLEGYASYEMFGDSVDRPVEFTKPLAALRGKTVRLRFTLRDAHLYSYVLA